MASSNPANLSVVSPHPSGVSSGSIIVPAGGAETLIAKVGVQCIGELMMVGAVGGVGPLTDLRIALSAAAPLNGDALTGLPATELSGVGGDFATPAGILERATTNPHTTASGGVFRMALNLGGTANSLYVYAKSQNGAILNIDFTGAIIVTTAT